VSLRSRLVSPYALSALEQGLGSLLNLGVNLLLVRYLPQHEYGAFVFWANTGFVLSSLQNAVSGTHLYTLSPGGPQSDHRRHVERLMHAVTLGWLALVGALALLGGGLIRGHDANLHAWTAALFLPAFLLQQYVRALAFSRGETGTATVQTGLVVVLSGLFLAVSLAGARALQADAALAALAAAYGLAGVIGFWRATRGQWTGWRPRELEGYLAFARHSGWIFVGVSTTELLTRFYSFVTATTFGAAALAGLSASQLLLRPIPLLATSWSMVARGDLARRRDEVDRRGIARLVYGAAIGGVALTLGWTLLVHAAWGPVSTQMFGGKYGDLGWMVLVWGLCSGLSFVQTALSSALQVMRAFKPIAIANSIAAGAAVLAIVGLMRLYGPAGAVLGTAVGQTIEAVLMVVILRRALRALG